MLVEVEETIETRTMKIWRGKDDILYSTCIPAMEHSFEDARVNHEACKQLSKNNKIPLLIDIREAGNLSREARSFYASEENGTVVGALALLVDNAFSKMLGNFFMQLSKPNFPTQMFTTKKEAVEWLKSFKRMG